MLTWSGARPLSLCGSLDEASEEPMRPLPLGLRELSEEASGVDVDRLLGPHLHRGLRQA
jgi:hypothetical protein